MKRGGKIAYRFKKKKHFSMEINLTDINHMVHKPWLKNWKILKSVWNIEETEMFFKWLHTTKLDAIFASCFLRCSSHCAVFSPSENYSHSHRWTNSCICTSGWKHPLIQFILTYVKLINIFFIRSQQPCFLRLITGHIAIITLLWE